MNSFRQAVQSGNGPRPQNPLVGDKDSRGAEADDLESVAISRSARRTADHRDEDRHRLASEAATALHNGNAHPVEVINLSGGGAMIGAAFRPNLWDRIDLQLGHGASFECAVRWLRDDRIGVEFAHETQIDCDPETRDTLLLEVIRRSFPQVEALPDRDSAKTTDGPADAGHRADRRHPLIWNGQIHFAHDSNTVRLRNISSGGALVEVSTIYPEGAEVMLDLGDAGEHFATVSWTHGDQAGLAFKQAFDVTCLAKAKPVLMSHKWTRPGFLDPSAGESSPWDEQWSRSSLEGLKADLEGYMKR